MMNTHIYMLVSWLHEPEKTERKKTSRLVHVRARTEVKILLRYSTGKSNPTLRDHISNFSDNVAVFRAHESCCRIATLQLEHVRVDRRVVYFGIRSVAEVVAERRNVGQEKNTGRGASSRRFVQKIG